MSDYTTIYFTVGPRKRRTDEELTPLIEQAIAMMQASDARNVKPSVNSIAEQVGINRTTLTDHWEIAKKLPSGWKYSIKSVAHRRGCPTFLPSFFEDQLANWVRVLASVNFAPTPRIIMMKARMLSELCAESKSKRKKTYSYNWLARFMKRHELKSRLSQEFDTTR
jgi:hypothetical protein